MSQFILGRYYTIFHDHLEVDLHILFEKSTGPLLRAVLLGDDLIKKFLDAVLLIVDVQIAEERFQSGSAVIIGDGAVLRRTLGRCVSAALIDSLFLFAELRHQAFGKRRLTFAVD